MRSPEKPISHNLPQIQSPESGAVVVSPQEGAVANVSPSVASQESSGSGGSQAADYVGSFYRLKFARCLPATTFILHGLLVCARVVSIKIYKALVLD